MSWTPFQVTTTRCPAAEYLSYLLLLLCIFVVFYSTRLNVTKNTRDEPPRAEASQAAPHRHSRGRVGTVARSALQSLATLQTKM